MCEAYIHSQKAEGWTALPAHYDDGGISGGTLARPALRQLLEDIEQHEVDQIIVYRIDRLTRSLSDFAKLIDRFDAHDVSMVSVSQPFDTGTSMGRSAPGHAIHPYLLRDVQVDQPNQVWALDITYLPMSRGFLYFVAVMDWASRRVLSWRLSNTMKGRLLCRSLRGSAGRIWGA